MDGDAPLDTNKILKNVSLYYPAPPDRLIFIDCFCELINRIIQEMKRILGVPITRKVVLEIDKVRLDIVNFYIDSPIKRKALESLDKIVTQYPM